MPHLRALLFQLRRALTRDVLANRFPAVVRAGAKEDCAADRKTVLAAGRNIVETHFLGISRSRRVQRHARPVTECRIFQEKLAQSRWQ